MAVVATRYIEAESDRLNEGEKLIEAARQMENSAKKMAGSA